MDTQGMVRQGLALKEELLKMSLSKFRVRQMDWQRQKF